MNSDGFFPQDYGILKKDEETSWLLKLTLVILVRLVSIGLLANLVD